MELARAVRLPVARVALERFGEPVLVVERYDRGWDGDVVERKHLIDGCQMLNLPPAYKYERPYGRSGEAARIRTGASLPKLFASCDQCRIPAAARRDLLNWVLYQLLIGNSDAHAKNISFYVGTGGIDVAPFYDLLCIDSYGDEYDRDLAMAIGDEFVPGEILPYQLAEMCDACQLPQRQVATALRTLCTNALKAVEQLPLREELVGEELDFARELVGRLTENATSLLGMARELPSVKL
jgi:serine/threonine-protein kinase HipA